MPQIKDLIFYILIIGFALVFFFKGCNDKGQEVKVILTYDSLPHSITNSTIEKPVVIKSGAINLPDNVIQVLSNPVYDTALLKQVYKEIAEKYYAVQTQRIVSETDSIQITTTDTLSENRILGRNLTYKLKFPISTTIISKERNKAFIGVYLCAGQNGLYSVAPEITFENKKGLLLSVNYNLYSLATNKDKFAFGVGVAQKIRLRKN